jgi:hypothetical protein
VTCSPTKYCSTNKLAVIKFMKLKQLIVKHNENDEISGSRTCVNEYLSFFGR